jgi:hypothetical protein
LVRSVLTLVAVAGCVGLHMYNVATDAFNTRRLILAKNRRRRPCKVGLIRHGDMVGYYGRLRLDRRVEVFGLKIGGSQLSC